MRRLIVIVIATSVAALAAACSSGDVASPGGSDGQSPGSSGASGTSPASGPVTFHKDVEPVLQKVCQNCHVAGGIAPFALLTYADAKAVSGSIVSQTQQHIMPPWGAQDTTECKPPRPWKDDLRLSEAEIAMLDAWHAAGDPEGDPKDAPPPRVFAPSSGLAGATSLSATTPFTPAATGQDTFRCFVLDPKIAATTYLTGTSFVPTNKTIVHHALLFSVPPGTAIPGGDAYDCFGGPGVDGVSLVAAWAPGGVPNVLPADVGLPLTAGTKFVMQVHYHPHANATKDPDQTAFQFSTTSVAPKYQAKTVLLGNFTSAVDATTGVGLEPGPDDPNGVPQFMIPAGKSAHVETMRVRMPSFGPNLPSIWLLGVGSHMHLAGHDEKITLTHGTTTSCLMQEPAWNFNWQRGYAYDAPIESLPTVSAGDILEMRCTYDNTLGNVALASALAESGKAQPQDISLGEQTTNEMCLGAFTFVYPAPP